MTCKKTSAKADRRLNAKQQLLMKKCIENYFNKSTLSEKASEKKNKKHIANISVIIVKIRIGSLTLRTKLKLL